MIDRHFEEMAGPEAGPFGKGLAALKEASVDSSTP